MMIPEDFQLRAGLTVTVSIILEERNDVLLVPNVAITGSGGQTYVKVLSPDGIIEDRLVTTGISDWQYTEIIDGLSEGEKIVIPETTSTTPVQGGQGGIRIPGMGGFGR
jgi:multidrug efflux pump subunit AcrA (membrane-fusion protein)